MPILVQIIIASAIISSLSLVGIVILVVSKKRLQQLNLVLIALAAGTMMGGAFFHLIPESAELLLIRQVGLWVMFGFLLFFALEKLFHWHHCQSENYQLDQSHSSGLSFKLQSANRSLGYLNLTADFFHNFIDGVVMAAAFMVSPAIGVSTTVAVALHEIPQELGDFGVLIHAGFKPERALLYNFLTAWSALLGALLGYFVLKDTSLTAYLLPFTAGGFIYIGASDLIPEIKHQPKLLSALGLMIMFLVGLAVMWSLV